MEQNPAPHIDSALRHGILRMPAECYAASGIIVNGRRIKTFVFTTDLAIIRNCDADAVFAVYPFTPQQAISEAIIKHAYIPVIITVTRPDTDIDARLNAGASILNVACAAQTPEIVADIRARYPDVPMIASGGPTGESIRRTIQAGANAVTYTPPSTAELFKRMMEGYRE